MCCAANSRSKLATRPRCADHGYAILIWPDADANAPTREGIRRSLMILPSSPLAKLTRPRLHEAVERDRLFAQLDRKKAQVGNLHRRPAGRRQDDGGRDMAG